MRIILCNVISVLWTFIKFGMMKLFLLSSFHFSVIERFSPRVVTDFSKKGKTRIGKKVRAHSGCKFKTRAGGKFTIGDNVRINYNCIFVCKEEISIGEGTEFGPSVCIYDHDHDYKSGLKEEKFLCSPVVIGKNCWIGANTVILRGTRLGDNCVVGAGCVLKGSYSDNSVIVQKRETSVRAI